MDDSCTSKIPPISLPSVSSVADSGLFVQQDLGMAESVCTAWTNEKHSLYLKSMEASFVDQLYDSMDLLGLRLPKDTSDQNLSTSYGQFKVLRGGCWSRINFQRPDTQVNVNSESHDILTSPWIQHFRSARQLQITPLESDASLCEATNLVEKKTGSCRRKTCSRHFYQCHHDVVGCNTEVSDQNFVDEDIQPEKKSCTCSSKRLKIRTNRGSCNGKVTCSSACN